MSATDNSTVQISIKVVDANSGEVVGRATKNLNSMGNEGASAGKKLKSGLDAAGEAGTASGKKIGDGMKAAGGHSLNALDNVRLVRDDLGIRIPRAMEKVISQSKFAMAAIGGIGGGLVALGGIEIFARLAVGAYEFYERVFDGTGQLNKLQKKMGEVAEQKFFDVASIEEVNVNLQKTSQLINILDARRRGMDDHGTLSSIFHSVSPSELYDEIAYAAKRADVGKREGAAIGQTDDDVSRQHKDAHEAALSEIRDNHARQSALKGMSAAQAELNEKIAEAKENARYTRRQVLDQDFIINRSNGVVDPSDPRFVRTATGSADTQEQREIASARAEYSGKTSGIGHSNAIETRKLEAEGREAGLQAEAKYFAAKQEQIRELREKVSQGELEEQYFIRQRSALEAKYAGDRLERLTKERAETDRLKLEANTGGLTGVAKIDAQRDVSIGALNKEAPGFSDPNTKAEREKAIRQRSQQEVEQQQTNFNDRLQQLDAARADRFESESAKIDSAANRSVAEIMKAWGEAYGQLGIMDQRYVQSQAAVQAEITKIRIDQGKQQTEAGTRIEDETQKLEREARRVGQPKEREETQAILDAYADRYQHLEELRAQDAANADKYRRQEIAEEQIKNGKLVDLQRQMRDKLAGELQGLWSNPLDALKKKGEEMASKAAATYIMKAVHPQPGAMGTGGKWGGNVFGLPESWQDVGGFTHRGPGMRPGGAPGTPGMPVGPLTATPSGAQVVHATTATIHVQSATITGMGPGGGFRNAAYTPGQSAGQRAAYGGGGGGFATGTTGGDFGLGTGMGSGGSAGPLSDAPSSAASSTPGASSVGLASASSSTASMAGSGLGAGGGLPDNVSSVIGNVQQMPGMIKSVDQLGKELGAGSLSTGLGKVPGLSGLGKLGSQLGDPSTKLGGAAGGALGLFSAFEGGGGFGGALQGGLAGAQLGAQVGGPIGAAIGAAGGAVIGFLGFGARHKAAIYDRHTVKPQLSADLRSFEAGSSDYQTVYNDMDKLRLDAKLQTRQMGSGAKGYFDDTIKPEIDAAQARLTRENKAGRSDFGMTAAQFHSGGLISGFGDLGTSSTEGFIHALMGERVINPVASSAHAQGLDAINSGASHGDMAAYYGGATTAPVAAQQADVNLHFHSPDAKGARDLLMSNKHHVRAALNSSYEENSGGYDFA